MNDISLNEPNEVTKIVSTKKSHVSGLDGHRLLIIILITVLIIGLVSLVTVILVTLGSEIISKSPLVSPSVSVSVDNVSESPTVNISGTPIPQIDIPTIAPANSKTFTSSKYNLSFNYPASLGSLSARTDTTFYNDEFVTFQNSPIKIQYWRFEGDFWSGAIAWENINSKDGKSCHISTIISGTNNTEFILAALCDGAYTVEDEISLTSSVFIVDQGLKTQSEVDAAKLVFEQIISTLSFDFSNVTCAGGNSTTGPICTVQK